MGTKNDPGDYDCYEKADPDEPMFVLLGRDPQAPFVVRAWAAFKRNEYLAARDFGSVPSEEQQHKLDEAERCAAAMEQWYDTKVVTP